MKKRLVPIWLSILFLILVIGQLGYHFYLFFSEEFHWLFFLINVGDIIAFIFAILYCVTGYKKTSSVFFKTFTISYLISEGLSIYGRIFDEPTRFPLITTAILSFSILFVFAIIKNLGKVRSFTLVNFLVIFALADVVMSITEGATIIITLCGKLVLSIIFFIMLFAKYKDKDARGTI